MTLSIEYLQASFDARQMNKTARKNGVNNTGMAVVGEGVFQCLHNGVRIIYRDGTKRFINNNWYNDEY